MKASDIRAAFLNFFKARDHAIVTSDSLIPKSDPTLLFTGAGMNQFKDYFLAIRTGLKRAASVQKCLRTGDLDQVGKTPYHHSFFEMLGNFSFGDYFKEQAIQWAWEFLTQEMGLSKERLYVSVHKGDEEAFEIWWKKIGIRRELIARLDDDSNFWPANAPTLGPNGPCGPCSEIFFDQGRNYSRSTAKFWADDESGRYAEIWNLVFTQFEREPSGTLRPLKAKNIDTGMGLERLACVVQGKPNNFEVDIFEPMIRHLSSKLSEEKDRNRTNLNAIADHVRAVVMAIGDGAHPTNEGRGYVVRKLIRRAVWHGRMSGLSIPLLAPMVPLVVASLEDAYPGLKQVQKSIEQAIQAEEERFQETLESGLNILTKAMEKLRDSKKKVLPGEEVFKLYDTYGFPDELTRTIARESGIEVDEEGFENLLDHQRKRAQASSKIVQSIFTVPEINEAFLTLPQTKFLGYETLESEGRILWCAMTKNEGAVVLDQTPFYPEGGGQVGDVGILEGRGFKFSVTDTQKKERVIIHQGNLEQGKPKVGDSCRALVNRELREATKRNHTATHLLQAALRFVLGNHVRQVGSLVSPERLRFDFTHGKAMTSEEIRKTEDWVNRATLDNLSVESHYKSFKHAVEEGALAFFGDKYDEDVRIINVPGRSKELCGGTHCHQTAEIGAFIIASDSSIGSGTRRIEAVTGMNAINYTRNLHRTLAQIASRLKVSADQAVERVENLQKKVQELERSSGAGKDSLQKGFRLDELIQSSEEIGTIKLVSTTFRDEEISFLRELVDQARKTAKQAVLALFSTKDSNVNLVVALTKDLASSALDAKEMAQTIAPLLDGSAGGRKDLAQGGGRNSKGIEEAVKTLAKLIRQAIG